MPEIAFALNQPIGITSIASISPLGTDIDVAWQHYLNGGHFLKQEKIGDVSEWIAPLPATARKEINRLKTSSKKYEELDDSVLYAIYASRIAIQKAGWGPGDNFGVNIGSSRGATELFEKYHKEFLNTKSTSTLSSPTTTLGNIASWVGHDLGSSGPTISHSITCSTALHALLNGVAWIKSGLTTKFLVGGSEAPLTPFTIAQMKALKIYSGLLEEYPCKALDFEKTQNTMVLGEAASVACLEKGISEKSLALIEGIGFATEPLKHGVSISTGAVCFQDSMRMALGNLDVKDIDVIIMHAPGTLKGDCSEKNAIDEVFGAKQPLLSGNKWKLGHTFGASGMLSIEMAVLMLQHQKFIEVPYLEYTDIPDRINRVLVNAVGFGGNAVSILLKTVSGIGK